MTNGIIRRCLEEVTIDKERWICYNIQAVNEAAKSTATRSRRRKKFEKLLKKGLTKGSRCDIISKLSRKRQQKTTEEVVRSLKIEQQ
mgnify:CR=1 FL=1